MPFRDLYVAKSFSIRELMARIRALLRRAQPAKALPDELRFDDVVVNFVSYEAHRAGRPLEMTRKEFQLLRLLASRTGEVVGHRNGRCGRGRLLHRQAVGQEGHRDTHRC